MSGGSGGDTGGAAPPAAAPLAASTAHRRRRRRHAVGLACILGTSVCWIASSFISQALVTPAGGGAPPRLPPLLLCYLCTSLFSLYLPVVATARRLAHRRQGSWPPSTVEGEGQDGGTAAAVEPLIASAAAAAAGEVTPGDAGGNSTGGRQGLSHRRPLTGARLTRAALMVGPAWFAAQLAFAWCATKPAANPQSLAPRSLALTSVTSNTIISSSSCLFAFLASVLVTKTESFTVAKASSVGAVMAGTAAVALADSSSSGANALQKLNGGAIGLLGPVAGDLLATLAAALYAVYTLQIESALGPASTSDTALFFGTLGLLTAAIGAPLLAFAWTVGALDLSHVTPAALGLACLNGVIDYVIADFLWARAVLLVGPTVATLGLSAQVPMAAAADAALGHPAWLAGGRPALLTVGGGALILAGFVGINAAGAGHSSGDSSSSSSGGSSSDVSGGGGGDEEAAVAAADAIQHG